MAPRRPAPAPALPQAPPDPSRLRRSASGEYPNHVWAIDFQFDETADYRRLKIANIVDEFTREALAMEVDRSITADRLIDVIERLVVTHGAPEHLRMDNGPELLSWALRDWCRFTGTRTIYIEPGSPWENPFVESFNGRARDELLNIEEFADAHRSPRCCRSLASKKNASLRLPAKNVYAPD